MDFTAAELKTLSQRDFVQRQIADFSPDLKVDSVPNESQTADPTSDDDRDVVVCVRLRPVLSAESERGIFPTVTANKDTGKVLVHSLEYKFDGRPKVASKEFCVDYAFDSDTNNEEVYAHTAKKLIAIALGGGVATLLATGQTGSGKTHTMTAVENFIARDLFEAALDYRKNLNDATAWDSSSDLGFEFRVCFFELLGNKAYDLLAYPNEITIMEDVLGQVQVKGTVEEQVRNSEDLLSPQASSRSHAVCRITIKDLRYPASEEGLLYLLDLAGSESSSDSRHHDKERTDEKKEINQSLATLKDCIRNRALAVLSTKHVHVPYRNSRLTVLLKSAFELATTRACRTVVIATVNPSILDTLHSLNTLRYVSPLKVEIPPSSEASPDDPSSWSNAKLREWVSETSNLIEAENLCSTESGRQLLKLPESMFVDRCLKSPGVDVKTAKAIGNNAAGCLLRKCLDGKFWRLVVDARTKVREDKERAIRLAIAERRAETAVLRTQAELEAWHTKQRDYHIQWMEMMMSKGPEYVAKMLKDQKAALENEISAGEELKSDPEAYALWLKSSQASIEYQKERIRVANEYIDKKIENNELSGAKIFAAVSAMK
ncbi:hypothetical protein HK100_003346 [Physocladia obscura]|uniref:Kinesin motor domain-containing protein n=1 Tax=Physocladia obscura TaxID=109957 RepID=A0AAD5SUF7_9FUNG|nr:hypothetical protein HK100_003346 [Physocladia obscura]